MSSRPSANVGRMQEDDPFDVLVDGVVIADGEGRVTVCNRAARRMLGLGCDDVVGRPFEDVLALADSDGCGWTATNTPYAGLGTRSGIPEQSWLTPSGEEVLVAARLVRAAPGAAVSQVAVSLRSGRGRARLDRDRSDLVATVAHELRSPLTGVKGFVQVLLNRWDRLSDEQKKLMLTTVSVDSDRLSRLIAELLDVARIDTGRLSIYTRPVDPVELTRRVVDSVSATTARPVCLDVGEVGEIEADPDKFTQVVTNLVENAVRHGDGEVRVSLERSDAVVLLTVEDDGEGVPAEMRRRAFTKFWTHGRGGGSGLGLYIVHGLTTAHGGTVEIGDAASGGARIAVRWPGPT